MSPPRSTKQALGRAMFRTLRAEFVEGTLAATVRRTIRAKTLSFADEPSIGELLSSRAAENPSREFLRWNDRRITLGELNADVNALAAGLATLTRPGDNIAIFSPNCPEFIEAFFAIQKLGLGAVPVNTALVGDGLAHVLSNSSARVAFVHRDLLPQLASIRERLPDLAHVVPITEREGDDDKGTLAWWRAAHRGASTPLVRPDPDRVALLLYTSGTTGAAKGVIYRYRDSNTKRLRLFAHLLYEPGDVLYTCLPLFHANALLLTTVEALASGHTVALGRRFSASRFWSDARALGGTTFNALGAMIPILLKQPPGPDDRTHGVRLVVSAACPTAAWRPFEERFGVRIVEAYGAVDAGGFLTVNFGDGPVGSIGKPLAGKYRLVDSDGRDVPDGEPGELWVKESTQSEQRVEYYKDHEATRAKTDSGWIHTGDLLRKDREGYLFFVGRRSDSMRRRGENVSAHEVESVVAQHPDVLECAAFGVPSELGEHDIMTVVVPVEGGTIDPPALRAFLEQRLARHALPRYIEVVDQLPKTSTHRVQKHDLARRGVTNRTWDHEREKSS